MSTVYVNPFEDAESMFRVEFPFSNGASEVFYVAADTDEQMVNNLMEYFDKQRPDAFMSHEESNELSGGEKEDYMQDSASGQYVKYMWPNVDEVQKMENIHISSSVKTTPSNKELSSITDTFSGNLYEICEEAREMEVTDLIEKKEGHILANEDQSVQMSLDVDDMTIKNNLTKMIYDELHSHDASPQDPMKTSDEQMKKILDTYPQSDTGLRM